MMLFRALAEKIGDHLRPNFKALQDIFVVCGVEWNICWICKYIQRDMCITLCVPVRLCVFGGLWFYGCYTHAWEVNVVMPFLQREFF